VLLWHQFKGYDRNWFEFHQSCDVNEFSITCKYTYVYVGFECGLGIGVLFEGLGF